MSEPSHTHDPGDLVPVEEAVRRVLDGIAPLQPVELPLPEAHLCVAVADVLAPHDLPTFASSAMDGFAVRAADVAAATPSRPAALRISGAAPVGRQPDVAVGGGEAVRIATGAPVPEGADAVVPIEVCAVEDRRVLVLEPSEPGRFVRPAGQDVREGDVLVRAGTVLMAPELGLLAAAGLGSVAVHPRPRVVVLSTGDELVEPGRPAEFGKVHDANSFTLFGALRECGAVPYLAGLVGDDVEAFRYAVESNLARADAFASSGGVSVGERDVVKAAFRERAEVTFSRVAMQPGMPQAFGSIEGKPFFGLPGNPVSVFVSFEVFVRPGLLKMMGRRNLARPEVWALLDDDLPGLPNKTRYSRVRVRRVEEGFVASPTGGPQSNLVATVARGNGLAVVPPGTSPGIGDRVRVLLFRDPE